MNISIRLRGVSKSFGETRALTSLDFEACPGEVHAIVGENGSGKSTLAKIMSGIISHDHGDVEVLGRAIHSPLEARKRGVATIFQEVLVADEASVLDNLYVGSDHLLRRGKSLSERIKEGGELLERCVGQKVDLTANVGTLPLYIKQWIVIVRAFLRQPKILILDESSAALDLDATQRLHEEIKRLRDANTTVVIVTHRIAELINIADRATILRDGKAVGVLKKNEITESRLLELMTPSGRTLSETPAVIPRGTGRSEPIMHGKAIKLFKDADQFDFVIEPGMIVGLAGLGRA